MRSNGLDGSGKATFCTVGRIHICFQVHEFPNFSQRRCNEKTRVAAKGGAEQPCLAAAAPCRTTVQQLSSICIKHHMPITGDRALWAEVLYEIGYNFLFHMLFRLFELVKVHIV